eukprot:TRINITY_DN1858_c1_g1_i1.p1 TRINITY_DN1858_c1_g1~~TRINITY_DN1858_c1_g1_i1.p1  ORF type:complete len:461 (+),score=139.23 TRINITY_DN1858_c1_g1_i1:174-1385(+)
MQQEAEKEETEKDAEGAATGEGAQHTAQGATAAPPATEPPTAAAGGAGVAAGEGGAGAGADAFHPPWHPNARPPPPVQHHMPSGALYRQQYIFTDQHPLPGDCYRGQLTMAGMVQMLEVGHMLRRLYVERIPLLPRDLSPRLLYVRSSDSSRTVQSAQCVLEGMYHHTRERPDAPLHAAAITIHTMDRYLEHMYGRSDCPALRQLKAEARKHKQYTAYDESMAPVRERVAHQLGYSKWPGWVVAHNTLECIRGNGLRLSGSLSPEDEASVREAASLEGAIKFANERIVRLSLGRFTRVMMQHMDASLSGASPARFFLYSGHDNTLSPLLGMLGLLKGHPPMASNLILEVWEAQDGRQYVHVMFNGESQTLPGADDPVCPLDVFRERMRRFSLSDEQYRVECAV